MPSAKPSAKKSARIPVGTVLVGKYRVTREIGRGGMAAVYECEHVDIGKRMAVKVLNPELTHSAVVVERFVREARAAAAVQSPYICDVYDAGRLEDGRPYLLLELLEGESLYERMVKVRRFESTVVARVFSQVARGLTKAHEANIIHRDLKPENIFLTKGDDGEVLSKILDFGLAKFYAPVDGPDAQQRLTREGAVFGTPAYMSPEQVKGQGQVDHRADLWALGCMVYECLVGRTVWSTEQGVAMIFAQVATADLPIPSRMRPDLPAEFDHWFSRALSRDPALRYQTAKELADELVTALGHGSPSLYLLQPVSELEQEVLRQRISSPGRAAQSQDTALAATERPPPVPGPPPVPSDYEAATQKWTPPASSGGAALASPPQQPEAGQAHARLSPWFTGIGALVVALAGVVVWVLLIRPPRAPVAAPTPIASSVAAHSSSARAPILAPAISSADLPEWAMSLSAGQEQLSKGNIAGAVKAFREAAAETGSGVPRVMLENAQVAATSDGPCKVTALGRPRPFNLATSIRRPDVVQTVHGPLVVWADDHENSGQWHAYTSLLDAQLRAVGRPVDVTPESSSTQDPSLLPTETGIVLFFSEHHGAHVGVFARMLTATGRISGAAVQITGRKSSTFRPSMVAADSNEFWVLIGDDAEKGPSSRVSMLRLDAELKPKSPPVMIAEFASKQGLHRSHTRAPSLAVSHNTFFATYRVEKGREHQVQLQRIPIDAPELKTGLEAEEKPKSDRTLGALKEITGKKKGRTGFPTIACDPTVCFVVWRNDPKGANAAYIDPTSGDIIWSKRFAVRGTQVSVELDGSGGGLAAWYQDGRVRVAPVTRDGTREPTAVGRVTGEQARPAIAKGTAHGEWLVAWTDYEAGHLEVYVTKVACR